MLLLLLLLRLPSPTDCQFNFAISAVTLERFTLHNGLHNCQLDTTKLQSYNNNSLGTVMSMNHTQSGMVLDLYAL